MPTCFLDSGGMDTTVEQQPARTAGLKSRTGRLLGGAAAAVAVSLLLYFPDRDDGSGAILGGLSAFVGVLVALSLTAKVRALPARSASEHAKLLVRAVGIGLGVGLANLGVNRSMAAVDAAIYDEMVTRWAEFSPWSVLIREVVMEELVYRLVLMSFLAWLVARFTANRRKIFHMTLAVSAAVFGVMHIFYGGVGAPLYAVGMAVKSSAAGVVFGWIYWRWGLGYSMVSHSATNGIHLLLMPYFF
jgi:membrane protease YdiL (CAAX protease family)